ncbi:SGNH/GDSL hydrolase family protein [Roseateles sp. GG27B]
MKSFKRGASRFGLQGRSWMAMAALAALTACGGGTQQIEPFAPTRIIAFGDESSVITSEGKKYTVNALDATTGLGLCASNPLWIQDLATTFSLVFPQCNPSNIAATQGLMYATVGAKVADLTVMIDKHFATSTFGPKDLVTVLVGSNDVFELFAQYPIQSRDAVVAAARARGTTLGQQINRIANANGRVIVSTLPDLGLTPFAQVKHIDETDTARSDRIALLSNLSNEFNVAMRLQIINDGRLIGLVLADETTQAIAKFPSAFGYANVVDPVCLTTVAVQDCTINTLVANGSGDTWLWATDRLLSPAGQHRIGLLAVTRARNNPF